MRILWVVNTVFPDIADHAGIPSPVFGGWMYGLASDLSKCGNIRLAVATVFPGEDVISLEKSGIQYYLTPRSHRSRSSRIGEANWRRIVDEFCPDLVHIHGTEYAHGADLMRVCKSLKYVISIQGLVSVCHRYYLAGMSMMDVVRNITLRDVLRGDTLFQARRKFYRRGLTEIRYIRAADAVIGRTEWDYAHVNAIRPGVPYYFCNESLRDEFYTNERWHLSACKRYSIFLSQASYPVKGLHQVLKAAALLKKDFPEIQIVVAGPNIYRDETWSSRLRISGYGKYVRSLISDLGLADHVEFKGELTAQQMKVAYLNTHVFVCPSSIENSPNSLGEAQILGVPTVAAYVGGIPSMTEDADAIVLYQFDEYEVLAQSIRKVFLSDDFAARLSRAGVNESEKRHSRFVNKNRLLDIYSTCLAVD